MQLIHMELMELLDLMDVVQHPVQLLLPLGLDLKDIPQLILQSGFVNMMVVHLMVVTSMY